LARAVISREPARAIRFGHALTSPDVPLLARLNVFDHIDAPAASVRSLLRN